MKVNINDVVEFNIQKLVKGGFVGYKDDVEFFLPKSLSALKEDKSVIGKKVKAKVKEFKENSIVVDRKAYLNEINAIFDKIKDKKVLAKVTKIKDNGLVIEVENMSGFVPKEEIFYQRIDHKKYFSPGDEIEVMLIDPIRRSFSIKKTLPNPWESIKDLNVGDIVRVSVCYITKSGVFVDLGNGVEGFLHMSEINWEGKNDLTIGEEIEVEIVEIDIENEKLRVSRKNLLNSPAKEFAKKYKIGDLVEGIVVKFIDVGAFVEVDGIVALMPNKFASYKKGEKANDVFEIGQKALFKVINIVEKENKIILSRKDALSNPYEKFAKEKKIGDIVTGKVKHITNFGMFIDLGEVEALVKKEDYKKSYKLGDKFTGKIANINQDKVRLVECE